MNISGDKYHLKSVHEEIDLIDRKLAHLMKFEKFDSETARDSAAGKLTTKRATLVKTALRLAAEGVEFKPSELPRSLRSAEELAAEAPKVKAHEQAVPAVVQAAKPQADSVYAGTALDWQASIAKYIEKRKRTRGGDERASGSGVFGADLGKI